jgi:hypothetical protein
VEVLLRPEPSDAERRAILRALERLLVERPGRHAAYDSRWRRSGLVFDGPDYAGARLRSSRGASRA